MILLGDLQKMYSTNLAVPHLICSELTPQISQLLSFRPFLRYIQKALLLEKVVKST